MCLSVAKWFVDETVPLGNTYKFPFPLTITQNKYTLGLSSKDENRTANSSSLRLYFRLSLVRSGVLRPFLFRIMTYKPRQHYGPMKAESEKD